jgi:hypothetical protein
MVFSGLTSGSGWKRGALKGRQAHEVLRAVDRSQVFGLHQIPAMAKRVVAEAALRQHHVEIHLRPVVCRWRGAAVTGRSVDESLFMHGLAVQHQKKRRPANPDGWRAL